MQALGLTQQPPALRAVSLTTTPSNDTGREVNIALLGEQKAEQQELKNAKELMVVSALDMSPANSPLILLPSWAKSDMDYVLFFMA